MLKFKKFEITFNYEIKIYKIVYFLLENTYLVYIINISNTRLIFLNLPYQQK